MTQKEDKPKRSAAPRLAEGSAPPPPPAKKPSRAAQKAATAPPPPPPKLTRAQKLFAFQAGQKQVRTAMKAAAKARTPNRPPHQIKKALHASHPEFGKSTRYTRELAALICARIASGSTMIEITEEPGMPSFSTICGWDFADRRRQKDKWDRRLFAGFSEAYTHAREIRLANWEERLRLISSTPTRSRSTLRRVIRKGPEQQDAKNETTVTELQEADDPGARRLEIDTLKWLISNERVHLEKRRLEHLPRDEHGRPLVPQGLLPGDGGGAKEEGEGGGGGQEAVVIRVLGGLPTRRPDPA